MNIKNLKYFEKLDNEIKKKHKIFKNTDRTIVPLTEDRPFKSFFSKNPDFLKEFLILELNLDIKPDKTTIDITSEEYPVDKIDDRIFRIDILVYLNNNIITNIEANSKNYNEVLFRNLIYVAKLVGIKLLKKGEDIKKLKSKQLFQLNINSNEYNDKYGEDILELKGKHIKAKNFKVIIKNIAYYRKLYYNKTKELTKGQLWLVALSAKTYTELYKILCEIYDDENHIDQIMKEVFSLNQDKKILTDWENEMLNELVEYTAKENARKEGKKQGIEEGKKEGIKETKIKTVENMLKENISVDIISKVTDLSKEEILKIKKSISEN